MDKKDRLLSVEVAWGDTMLESASAFDRPAVTLDPALQLPIGTIARATEAQTCSYVVIVHEAFGGWLERADGTAIALNDLIAAGIEAGDALGTYEHPLRSGETLYLTFKQLTLKLRYVPRPRAVHAPMAERLDYRWLNMFVLALLAHGLAITAFLSEPSAERELAGVISEHTNRVAKYLLTPVKKENAPSMVDTLKEGPRASRGAGDIGRAGRRDGPQRLGRRASKAIDRRDPEEARRAIVAFLGVGAPRAAIVGTGGLGGDLEDALGGVHGPIRHSAGLDGLDIRGDGPGGGRPGPALIGIGELDRGGGGGGDGPLSIDLVKSENEPVIKVDGVTVRNSLDKTLIRRVIEENKPKIRYCYERELARTPGLFGKIDMLFVIGPDGRVQKSTVERSSLGDKTAEKCVADTILKLNFPKPRGGGIVMVRYPFVFKTSG